MAEADSSEVDCLKLIEKGWVGIVKGAPHESAAGVTGVELERPELEGNPNLSHFEAHLGNGSGSV